MYALEEQANDDIVMPVGSYEIVSASSDPMSSPDLLLRLFRDYENQDKTESYPSHFSALARNPSLPPQIFAALLVELEEYEEYFDSNSLYMDVRSYFFLNPLTTFEQVLSIVISSRTLKHITESINFESCTTVVEIFDKLVHLDGIRGPYFLSRLLCSPLVSVEDFRERLMAESVAPKLDNWIVFSSSRFIPTSADYNRALKDLSSMQSFNFERGIGIVHNENATPEFLSEAFKCSGGKRNIAGWVYENFNCPIEVSAKFYSEHLGAYEWSPSLLSTLEAKVNERFTLTFSEGPWEDLPLSWKLRMIAE